MSIQKDYAAMAHMDAWLRHPVLGDPSFDTFERIGQTVHRSSPPFAWTVNCSLFRDHDGIWYCYAGLYAENYHYEPPSRFRIYRSADQGQHWEDLGWGFEDGFCFRGDDAPSDAWPDAVVCYDEKLGKYLLTYDTYNYDPKWLLLPNPYEYSTSGTALAMADSPAGPFVRLPQRLVTNGPDSTCGRFNRCYASTVFPRNKDYIAFILMDSGRHFAWGLAVATAPSPQGPWTKPSIVLSCDTPGYYPCPVEFYPTQLRDGRVYCPATSVAKNRNYQALFEAPLEQAHDPAAWVLSADGNLWHARNHPDEHMGIWGQTFHGFIEPDTGRYVVVFPCRDAQGLGTLSIAARPYDKPHSDGFTLTGHMGPSISPLLCAYGDFSLRSSFRCAGTVDFAFAYHGILGPDDSISDAVPSQRCLSDYAALRIWEDRCAVVVVSPTGKQTILTEMALTQSPSELNLNWQAGRLSAWVDGNCLCKDLPVPVDAAPAPLALILAPFSRITCSEFAVSGQPGDYTLACHATDALLGAGQWKPEPETVDPTGSLAPDVWHRTAEGYVGEGNIAAKWNIIGDRFTLPLQRSPAFGTIGIWIDGEFQGAVDLQGLGETAYQSPLLPMGRHALRVAPISGRISITKLLVHGTP